MNKSGKMLSSKGKSKTQLMQSFNQYLLSSYYVLGIILMLMTQKWTKQTEVLASMEFTC